MLSSAWPCLRQPRSVPAKTARLALALTLLLAMACGQTGPLRLPEEANEKPGSVASHPHKNSPADAANKSADE